MVDVWVFGRYFSYNINQDESRTANRFDTKWRSQVKVPEGSEVTGNVGDWFYIKGTVPIVNISDIDYLLRNTDPVSDEFRIEKAQGATRVERDKYLGINPQIEFEYEESNYTPDATNPNGDRFPVPVPTPKPLIPPQFISFAEERLELGYDYGAIGGASFATEIIEVADDREQRNSTRLLPLGRWQLGDRTIADSEVDKLEEVSYLKQFHLDRLGCFQGFRFKDWADFEGKDQYIATGDGIKTEFQLRKAYKAGSAVTYRPIQKPVVGTVAIYVDGVNVAVDPNHDWVVNHETGVISNPTPLSNGAVLSANFEFDIPVWFESDKIDFRLEGYDRYSEATLYRLGSVFVVEGRIPLSIPMEIEPATEITEELDLGIVYETVESYEISNNKLALKSGYTKREAKREDTRISFNLGGRNYDKSEVDRLLGYFWNARGKNREFPFTNLDKNYKVRFNQDALQFRFEAANDTDRLFNLSGLKLQLKEQILYRSPPFSFPFTTITINPEDPNDPTISASNPSSGAGGGSGGGGGGGSSYGISSYSGSVGFDSLPDPSVSPGTARWQAQIMFWEANTLWLIIRSAGSSSANNNWYFRAALYRLNAQGSFEYVDCDLKEYYMSVLNNKSFARVYKTPNGTSLFIRCNNAVPFGTGRATGALNGMLRFEVSTSGNLSFEFIPDSVIPTLFVSTPTLQKVVALFGDTAYLDVGSANSSVIQDLRYINGLRYVTGNISSNTSGFPLNSHGANSDTTRLTEPFAWYYETDGVTRIRQMLRDRGNELLEEYFRGGSGINPSLQNVQMGTDGSILAKIYLGGVCPDDTCTSNFDPNITLEYAVYHCDSFDSTAEKLFRTVQPGTNEATFKFLTGRDSTTQRFNSDKNGNALFTRGSEVIFYRKGDAFAINIASQLPTGLKTNEATTPYGFALFAHNSDMFLSNSNETLVFVQNQDV